MNKIFPILLFCLVLISCGKVALNMPGKSRKPASEYMNDGISLTCPSDWKITDDEVVDDGSFLIIEKKGFASSGIFSLTWFQDSLDLLDWISLQQSDMANQFIYKNANLTFSKAKQDQYNNYPTISTSFTASILGLKHRGMIHYFHGKDRSYSVFMQEALEDIAENRNGFEIIENSFVIK